ncbi:hypothetical protein DPMN_097381 [Dreissena polymorpha]|uniref:Uncharacterized protein n=1 Tax=Dreissena polymorpha TaxID=45954 RepID=A0A9D4LB68_DREPO|nr:hypothetical protein DPMN_097381 [Dreissena polymorpha]
MKSLPIWDLPSPVHFFSSMPLEAVTKCHSFLIVEKRLHGKHGPSFDGVTTDFETLRDKPDIDSINECTSNIERFVVLLYDRSSECINVDEARKDLFIRKRCAIDNIPPSSAALHQQIERAAYPLGADEV